MYIKQIDQGYEILRSLSCSKRYHYSLNEQNQTKARRQNMS